MAMRMSARKALYHHRTQGKAVEGIHIRGVIDALRARGVTVDVISLPGADPYATPKSMSPTRQTKWWMRLAARLPEPVFELAEIAYNAVAGLRLSGHFRRNPDVDFVYERYSLFMFVTVWIARRRRVPIVLEVNDAAFVDRVRPLIFRRLALSIERWTFANASGLVFVSSVFRDRALSVHGDLAPAIVTPNAANIADFTSTPAERDAARRRLGVEGDVVCGYLGAFVPWHAIDKFVYAIASRLGECPNLRLLLVGDGATYSAVKEFVDSRKLGSRVILAGRVAHAQVKELLAAMDLAILPSAGDYTSPVKLFEFMSAGIPPVAPDLAPILEVVEPGRTGWVFRAGDSEAAVAAVLAHAALPQELKRVGQAAREYVRDHRQWSNNVSQLLEFVASLSERQVTNGVAAC